MLFFLYLSGTLNILLGAFLFSRQNKKIKTKNLSEKQILEYWIKKMIVNIMLMCIMSIFLLFILPLSIWLIGPKEVGIIDKIIETKNLAPISSSNKDQYIKETVTNNVKTYVVNIGDIKSQNLLDFGSNSVEVISTKKESPKYEKIARYKITKLKGNNIIYSAVNDIYANVYIQYDEGKLVANKIKLIVP
ncbi:hypothetical protein ACJDU8_03995 [Clostridium sp. WILCCON 0269]|uniref:Uncharacterized protein n=1 Tax=Candidatus Clostridium eludens TaxID=3381663 RepID=A0ABW8SHN4_9CLOT